MDAYADTMGVYKSLQQSQRRLVEVNTAFAERSAMADFRFHLRRLLVWLGLGGMAASLDADTAAPQPAEQLPAGAAQTPR